MHNFVEYLRYRAHADRDRTAILLDGGALTFGRLAVIVAGAALQFRRLGVRPGQIVITETPDKTTDWILTLALMHEGAVTCSVTSSQRESLPFAWDWRVTTFAQSQPATNTLLIDPDWLERAAKGGDALEPVGFAPESPFRITLTSGTTGKAKASCQSLQGTRQRIESQLIHFGALPAWNPLSMNMMIGFNSAVNALMTGQPLLCVTDLARVTKLLERGAIEAIYASPAQLARLASELAAAGVRPGALKVASFTGVEPTATQLALVRQHLCSEIVGFYGATEVGRVCMRRITPDADTSNVGYPLPDCAIEIVDATDRPVAPNQTGSIRIRSPFMIRGYHGDAAATAAAFRDGWFYPGDRGFLRDDGMLVLAGRDREVVNRDGVKIDPSEIDRFLSDRPGIEDAAAFGYRNAAGILTLGVAIVSRMPIDRQRLRQDLLARFGSVGVPSSVIRVNRIPRNAMGKAERQRLAQALEAGVAREA
ncbi:MAG: hypothetical protein RIS35_2535 [Pseudomonadota bacterium]|jgi:acyl-coenzyme A synthetase/AMP-(fatty) acid ligase